MNLPNFLVSFGVPMASVKPSFQFRKWDLKEGGKVWYVNISWLFWWLQIDNEKTDDLPVQFNFLVAKDKE